MLPSICSLDVHDWKFQKSVIHCLVNHLNSKDNHMFTLALFNFISRSSLWGNLSGWRKTLLKQFSFCLNLSIFGWKADPYNNGVFFPQILPLGKLSNKRNYLFLNMQLGSCTTVPWKTHHKSSKGTGFAIFQWHQKKAQIRLLLLTFSIPLGLL